MGTVVTSSAVNVVYRDEFSRGSIDGVAEALTEKTGVMLAFHTFTALGAVLMIVFAAGLFRRLRAVLPDSIAPVVALAGLAGTAVVSILGSGLDTEFAMASAGADGVVVDDSSAAMYNHWIGTIPWLWTLAGLAGLAIFVAFRRGGAPRWLGLVGLVLGGLTVVLGVSPLEYMAAGDRRPVAARHRDRLHRGRQGLPRNPMNRLHDTPAGPVHHGPGRPGRVPHNVPVPRPLTDRRWATLVLPAVSVALLAVTVWLDLGTPASGPGVELAEGFGWPYAAIGLVFGLCCAVVLLHDPRQGFGWALGGIAIFWGLDGLAQAYVRYGISADDALPGVNAALWFLNRFGAFLPMTVAVLLAIFPTGRFMAGAVGTDRAGRARGHGRERVARRPRAGQRPGRRRRAASGGRPGCGVRAHVGGVRRRRHPHHRRGDRRRPPRHDGRGGRPVPPGERARAGPDALARVVGRRDGRRRRPVDVLRPDRGQGRHDLRDRLAPAGGHDHRHRPAHPGAGGRPPQRHGGLRPALRRCWSSWTSGWWRAWTPSWTTTSASGRSSSSCCC